MKNSETFSRLGFPLDKGGKGDFAAVMLTKEASAGVSLGQILRSSEGQEIETENNGK